MANEAAVTVTHVMTANQCESTIIMPDGQKYVITHVRQGPGRFKVKENMNFDDLGLPDCVAEMGDTLAWMEVCHMLMEDADIE